MSADDFVSAAQRQQVAEFVQELVDVQPELAAAVVKDGVLTISGERTREKTEEDKKKTYHRVERSYGKYQRSFRIPENVDPATIVADFKDGVLTVKMPKGAVPESEEHHVEVK